MRIAVGNRQVVQWLPASGWWAVYERTRLGIVGWAVLDNGEVVGMVVVDRQLRPAEGVGGISSHGRFIDYRSSAAPDGLIAV